MERTLRADESVTRAVSETISRMEGRSVEALQPLPDDFREDLDEM